ncbi:MAG: hypothetical protein V7678_05585 [Brevundimonas sp.]
MWTIRNRRRLRSNSSHPGNTGKMIMLRFGMNIVIVLATIVLHHLIATSRWPLQMQESHHARRK